METDRQSLKAYLKLDAAHKELHKTIKSLEEDATQDEVLRRLETVFDALTIAKKLLT